MAYVPNIPQQYLPAQPQAQEQLPLGTSAQGEEPLTLEEGSPQSSPETMEVRSQKFKYGLGDLLQKSKDEIFQNLQDGREDELRAQAASTIDDRKRQAAEKLIVDTTANKQGPLSPEEKQGLVDIIQSMNE